MYTIEIGPGKGKQVKQKVAIVSFGSRKVLYSYGVNDTVDVLQMLRNVAKNLKDSKVKVYSKGKLFQEGMLMDKKLKAVKNTSK